MEKIQSLSCEMFIEIVQYGKWNINTKIEKEF